MNELEIKNVGGQLVTESRLVAMMVEKEHKHLMRDIRGYVEVLEVSPTLDPLNFFMPSSYVDAQGKEQPCFLVTRKGCDMVANKMTGAKGILFTATYVTKFEEMEDRLKNPYGNLSPELQAIFAIDAKQQQIEVRVDKLENETTINYAQQQELKMTVSNRVILLLGGKQAPAYKRLAKKAFSECWNSYYQYVGVNAYANTAKVDYDRGRAFLMSWMPSQEMQGMIYTVNRGGVLY